MKTEVHIVCVCSIHSALRYSAPISVQTNGAKPPVFHAWIFQRQIQIVVLCPENTTLRRWRVTKSNSLLWWLWSAVFSSQNCLKIQTKQPIIGGELQKAALKPPSSNCPMLCRLELLLSAQEHNPSPIPAPSAAIPCPVAGVQQGFTVATHFAQRAGVWLQDLQSLGWISAHSLQ